MDSAVSMSLFSAVRSALKHFHDPIVLRSSPLVAIFHLRETRDPCGRLRQILRDAIESMEPDGQVPSHSRAWRVYEVLLYRYLEESTQQQVANQLGIGVRHLRREEHAAIGALVHTLAQQLPAEFSDHQATSAREENTEEMDPVTMISDNPGWLGNSVPGIGVELERVLPAITSLLEPLAKQHRVRLGLTQPVSAPRICGHEVIVRQILLNLLTLAIRTVSGGEVTISVVKHDTESELLIHGRRSSACETLLAEDGSAIDLTKALGGAIGARVECVATAEELTARVTFAIQTQVPILAIEDNADALKLLTRHVSGTRYAISAANNPNEALHLAQLLTPRAVVLDVMMPELDGWELLRQLKHDPRTSSIPVIVCTILPQEELARSLGAEAFLHKPVSRQALMRALDAVVSIT